MRKISTLFLTLAAMSAAQMASAQDLRIETRPDNGVEIVNAKWDKVNSLIGNIGGDFHAFLGEIDFGDGDLYKASSVDVANGWSTDGFIILWAGDDWETSEPITAMGINEHRSYYIPRRFGANMGWSVNGGVSEEISVGGEPLAYTKPVGKKNVYLSFWDGSCNIFAVNFYKNEFTEADFVKDAVYDDDNNLISDRIGEEYGGDAGIRLLYPHEDPRFDNKKVVLSIENATPAVDMSEDSEYADVRLDDDRGWGWTKEGFIVDYGTVDFGNNRFGQVMAELRHGSQNLTDYLEFYIDEVAEANKIGELWTGREMNGGGNMFPLYMNLPELSGSHKVFVKWIGGSTNVRDLYFFEGTPWTPAIVPGVTLVDHKPADVDGVFHFTFEGLVDGVSDNTPWYVEYKHNGNGERFESKGNVGYTGNGTVLELYTPDGSDIDLTPYETLVVRHSSEPAAVGLNDGYSFTFYADLDPDMAYTDEDWKTRLDEILEGHEPIAEVPMQGTQSWNTILHTRGEIFDNVQSCQSLFIVYNGAGANVFDLYFEPKGTGAGINMVTTDNGISVGGGENTVAVNVAENAQVAVYNLNGVNVAVATVAAGTTNLEVAPGFYIVKVTTAGATSVSKVIVK